MRRVAANTAVALGLAVVAYGAYALLVFEQPVPYAGDVADVAETETRSPTEIREPSHVLAARAAQQPVTAPQRLIIESIGVDHTVIPVALRDDGEMEVPDDVHEIGWYSPGVRPGELGSAVLAGHVDSRSQGRGAFFDLRLLEQGEIIRVVGEDGAERSWVVTSVVRYPKDQLPLEDLFRWEGERGDLVLITCGGDFDRTARSYVDNLVVHTEPLEGQQSRPRNDVSTEVGVAGS